MHLKGKYGWIKHIDFILIDLVSLTLAFFLSYYIKFHSFRALDMGLWRNVFITMMLIQTVINLVMNPYSGLLRRSFYEQMTRGLHMALFLVATASFILYLMKLGPAFSREVIIVTIGLYIVFSLSLKYIWKTLLVSGRIKLGQNKLKPLVIVGDNETLPRTLIDAQASDFKEYNLNAVMSVDGTGTAPGGYLDVSNLESFVLKNRISEVLVATDPKRLDSNVISNLIANGVNIHVNIESLFNLKPDDQIISRIGICKTVVMGLFDFLPSQRVYLLFKRMVDIVAGIVGCILLLPIMAVVKIINLKNGDHEKIFYTHKRIGKGGKEFKIYKFRSMVPNADKILQDLLKTPEYADEWAMNQKIDNDPRITEAGRLLRKTSLDEFPQFINVLRGDMSLIGPRPLVPGELEEHDGLQLYNKVRPGITGWWGCNGRSSIDYKERLDLEYHYIKHIGISIDIVCMFRTVVAVLFKKGAK